MTAEEAHQMEQARRAMEQARQSKGDRPTPPSDGLMSWWLEGGAAELEESQKRFDSGQQGNNLYGFSGPGNEYFSDQMRAQDRNLGLLTAQMQANANGTGAAQDLVRSTAAEGYQTGVNRQANQAAGMSGRGAQGIMAQRQAMSNNAQLGGQFGRNLTQGSLQAQLGSQAQLGGLLSGRYSQAQAGLFGGESSDISRAGIPKAPGIGDYLINMAQDAAKGYVLSGGNPAGAGAGAAKGAYTTKQQQDDFYKNGGAGGY
jgi:hypothetical protein